MSDAVAVDHTLVLNGHRFHYREAGQAGRPRILLLHGGGQSCRMWDTFIASIRDRLHVFALDQRGHGESEWPQSGEYSPDAFQRDLDAFVDELGLAPLHLCGLSMGGLNALLFAGRRPADVLSLALVDVAPEISRRGSDRIRSFYRGGASFDAFEDFIEYARTFNPRRSREQLMGSLRHSVQQREDGRWGWRFDLRLLDSEEWSAPGTVAGMWEAVASIPCPVLVVRGAESEILDHARATELAGRFPNGRYVALERASHSVVGDSPEAFRKAMESFLPLLD
jgi:pimeloyl-ACP methyl ester carboxylesterase